jgi:hypothetical protein
MMEGGEGEVGGRGASMVSGGPGGGLGEGPSR